MEQYKKSQIRFVVMLMLGGFAMIAGYVLFYQIRPFSLQPIPSIIHGVAVGGIIGYFSVAVWYFVRTVRIIRNPDFMEKLRVRDTDERAVLIGQKTGFTAMRIILILLAFAMVISGAFSTTIFWTVYCTTVVILVVYFSCGIYYKNKY